MRLRSSLLVGVSMAVGIGLAAPVAAMAQQNLYSYQGDDFSTDQNLNRQVAVCDEEADGHGVHADFAVNGSGTNQQVRDGDGSGNGCAFTGVYSNHIYRDRAVEEVNAAPDYFGPWVYPS